MKLPDQIKEQKGCTAKVDGFEIPDLETTEIIMSRQ